MAFTDEEKVKIRHHLGYLNVQQAATFALGSPAAVETSFIIESAMTLVIPAAETQARQLIAYCDSAEQQMVENQELLAVTKVGEIDIRTDEFTQLVKRYEWWRQGLCNILGVYPNPFDKRFNNSGINVPVRH